MTGRRQLTRGLGALALLVAVHSHAGTVRYVDDDGLDGFNCSNAPFATIGAAIAASKAGDEIRVCPGTYPEQIVVPFPLTIRGEAFGSKRAVIRPTAMPATLPGLDGGNPISAAVLDNGHLLRMTDVDIDLADNVAVGCSPVVAGIYIRNALAALTRVKVYNAAVSARPDCDSGVGILVESGVKEIVLGRPLYGKSRFIGRGLHLENFQKAGLVAIGPQTMARLEDCVATRLPALAGAAVPAGFEFANGARGKVINSTASWIQAGTVGKLAAGILAVDAGKVTFRRNVVEDNQVGVLVVGDKVRVKRGTFRRHTSDAIILLGDSNLVTAAEVDGASVSGVFVTGDHNVVRGGYYTNAPIGLWFLFGLGNAFYSITWGDIPLETRGLYGGLRDVTPDDAAPFLMRCTGTLSCDDGNACTTDLCDPLTGACSHGVTVCDDASVCTTDSCDPVVGCLFAPALVCADADPCTTDTCDPILGCQFTPCNDANACTTDSCDPILGCQFTAVVCDDMNPCTTDTCDPMLGCQFPPVVDGTPCGVGLCTGGVCL